MKDNNGEHVSYEAFEDTEQDLSKDQQPHPKKEMKTPITDAVKAAVSVFRIVLLGKSEDKKTRLGNFIIGYQGFHCQRQSPIMHCVACCREWRGKPLTVVKTPDLLTLPVEDMRKTVKSCVSLCPPGPNVLLLLVKPSELTEEKRKTLKSILSLFGHNAFKHSMVVITHENEMSFSVNEVLRECGGRHYNMFHDNYRLLMAKIQEMTNQYNHLIKPSLNLVLFGRRRAEKTLAAKAILGQTELHSASNSSECVKHQGEVCGRWVSLVELPALYGKHQQAVIKESLRCISLCNPEGVHAFILVLPVAPVTDEDKGELEIIQDAFSSRVNDFTMILFTVDSDPTDPAVGNFVKKNQDIQELCESCGGRSFVLNIKDKQQIPQLLETVEKISVYRDKSYCYTMYTFGQAQLEKMLQQEKFITQLSVTKRCQKEQGDVNGRPVIVVDTPGLFDNSLTHEQINEEMVKCISLLAPGPHVFLLVLEIGRLTPEEKETLELIRKGFGKNSEKFTIILLTKGDTLEHTKVSVEEYIEKSEDSFKKLISDCGGRYHVFNNFDKQNRSQVSELITKIDTMVKDNGGRCYTNEMLEEAEAAIQKEVRGSTWSGGLVSLTPAFLDLGRLLLIRRGLPAHHSLACLPTSRPLPGLPSHLSPPPGTNAPAPA
uniref:GTPase IMAP family member 8-like n=1 Tax=Maylandia zebra TaxID=106582 RepID=UPI000D30C17F|nr:GTPase IMAP family member 8-like [Maylandia zebra]